MTRKCVIKGCPSRSNSSQHRGVTFHLIPLKDDIRKIWLTDCRLDSNKTLKKNSFVCSRHFRRNDFQTNKLNKFLLKPGSVPTIFPWKKIQSKFESNQKNNSKNDNNIKKECESSNIMEKSKKSDNDTKVIQAPAKRPHDKDDDDNDPTNEIPLNKIPKPNASCEDLSQSTAALAASEISSDTKSCIIGPPTDIITSHQKKSDTNASNISFTLGNKIEAQDFNGTWHTAKVVEVDSDEREVLIRFEKTKKGKGGGVEEWIPMNSSRLRQITSQNSKKIISVFDVGEKCMAKWSGPRKFPATITKILGNDTYEVLFDDGFMKSVKGYNLTKIKQKTTPKKTPATTPTKKSPTKKDCPLISINSINLEELNLPDIPKDGEWCCHWVNDQPIGKEGFLVVGDHKKSTIIVEDWRLPPNWVKHMYQRSNILGKWDVILVNSQGKRFRSKADLKQHIEELGEFYNPDIYDFSIHRRRAKDIGAYVFTKDYKPPPSPASSHSQQYFSSLQEKNSENTEKNSPQIFTSSSSSLEPSSATKDNNVATNKLAEEEKPTVEDGYVLVGSLKVQIIDNLFRCPKEECNKNFRKENHLQIHVKHYHQELANLLGVCPNMQDLARKRTLGTKSDPEPLPKNHLPNVQFFAKLHQQELANRTHRKSTQTPTTSSLTSDVLLTPEQIKKEDQEGSSTPIPVPETIKPTDTENLSTPANSKNKSISDSLTPQTTEDKQSSSTTGIEDIIPATPQIKSQAQKQKPTTIGKKLKKLKKSNVKVSSTGRNRKSSRQKLTKKYIQSNALTTPITTNNSALETSFTHSDQEETRHSFNGNNSTSEITNKTLLTTLSSPLKKYKPEPLFIASDANLDATSQSQTTGSVQENSQSPKYINENGEIIKIVRMRQEEIINCLCSYGEEDGLMIQCELCLCWQHGICNGIEKESQVPEKYICYICRNPQRGRSSLKYIHDQDWMYEGKLPVANYHAPSPDLEERFEILRKTHILTGNLLELKRFMHSLKVKINIAENKDHPKMYLWTNKWETSPTKENIKSEKLLVVTEKNSNDTKNTDDENQHQNKDNEENNDDNTQKINKKIDDGGTTDSELKNNENDKKECEIKIENIKAEKKEVSKSVAGDVAADANILKQPTIPQPEAPINPVECQRRLLDHIKNQQLRVMDKLQTFESQIMELESLDDFEAVHDDENDRSKTKELIAMYIKDLETMKNIAKINTVQVTQNFTVG